MAAGLHFLRDSLELMYSRINCRKEVRKAPTARIAGDRTDLVGTVSIPESTCNIQLNILGQDVETPITPVFKPYWQPSRSHLQHYEINYHILLLGFRGSWSGTDPYILLFYCSISS